MSERLRQGTEADHDESLLQGADVWDATGRDAAVFQGSSSLFTPATYGTPCLTSPIDLNIGAIPAPPNLLSQQRPSQAYFTVPGDTSVEPYLYHQNAGSIAPENTAAVASVADGYCPDTWLDMSSNPMVAVAGAAAMPAQSQPLQSVDMSQYPAADAVGHERMASLPSGMSSATSNMMQPLWNPQWDAAAGLVAAGRTVSMSSSMASPTAIGQTAGADGGPTNETVADTTRKGRRAVGARGRLSVSSPSTSTAGPAPHAGAPGFPPDQASSQGGRRSSSITPRPSVHHGPGLEYQQHQVIGQPSRYFPACSPATVDYYSPGSHATTVGRSPSLGLSQSSRAPDSVSPAPYHQASPSSPPPATYSFGAPGRPASGQGDFSAASRHPSHDEATSSSATASIEVEFPTGADLKKEDLRRRNRKAASKCRAKSKDEETRLRNKAWVATETWTELSAETAMLQKEVRGLKRELHRHADCGNDLILEYLRSAGPPSEDDEDEQGAAGGDVAKQASL